MDPGPKSPNNKFVESGRKSQSRSRVQILVDSIKWKELQMHTCKKHPWTCPNSMIDSQEFFRFTVAFLQPFALLSLLCFFSSSLSLNPFSCYILWFFTIFSIHVRVRCQEFSCFLSPLLEPSTLSCKAAYLLFRHHLHINAARELAGQHLMRGQQYFQIFVIPHPYPLFDIFSSPYRKVPLVRFIKGLIKSLATSDRCSEMVIILGHG